MSVEAQNEAQFDRTIDAPPRTRGIASVLGWFSLQRVRTIEQAVAKRFSSSLTRRIVVLNLGGLVALLVGFLYLNQFREGLIDARLQSLQTQGEIIAAAIAASATVDTNAITIDPEKLLQLAPGDGASQEPAFARVLDQSRADRPGASPFGLADAHPRPYLRPRWLSAARFAVADRPHQYFPP